MPPGPCWMAVTTRASSGSSWSRLGPKEPSVPASASVWQLPQLLWKAALGDLEAVGEPPPLSFDDPQPARTRQTAATTTGRMPTGYVEREVVASGLALALLVPADAEALIDEEAFADDEFLPYWAELWPSALALAEVASSARGLVLELGCGLGVPSLIAAHAGAEVVATDWSPEAIALLRVNAQRVGARLEAQVWDWRDDPGGLSGDVVLAADVLYEARNGEPLLRALDAVVAPDGEAWIADPGRPAAPAFFATAAERWTLDPLAPRVTRLRRRARASA